MSSIGTLAMQVIANAASFKATMDSVDERIRQSKQHAAETAGSGDMMGNMLHSGAEGFASILEKTAAMAAAPLAAVRSFDALAEKMMEVAAEMGSVARSAENMDVGSGVAWEWTEALKKAGMETGIFEHGVMRMQRTIAQAAHGSAEAREELSSLGLDAATLQFEGTEQAVKDLSIAILAIPDKMERVRREAEIFGRTGPELERGLRAIAKLPGAEDKSDWYVDQTARLRQTQRDNAAFVTDLWHRAVGSIAGAWNEFNDRQIQFGSDMRELQGLPSGLAKQQQAAEEYKRKLQEASDARFDAEYMAGVAEQIDKENADLEKADALMKRLDDSAHAQAMGWSSSRVEVQQLLETLREAGNINDRDLDQLEKRLLKTSAMHDAEQRLSVAREAQKTAADRLMDADRDIAGWLQQGLSMEQAATLARKARADYARAQGAAEHLPQALEAGSAAGGRELIAIAAAAQEAQSAIALQADQLGKLGVENAKMIAGQAAASDRENALEPARSERDWQPPVPSGPSDRWGVTQNGEVDLGIANDMHQVAQTQQESNQTEAQQLEALNTIHDDLKQVIKGQPTYRPIIFE